MYCYQALAMTFYFNHIFWRAVAQRFSKYDQHIYIKTHSLYECFGILTFSELEMFILYSSVFIWTWISNVDNIMFRGRKQKQSVNPGEVRVSKDQ